MEVASTSAPFNLTEIITATSWIPPSTKEDSSDLFFYLSVVSPLVFCCFAIFLCALNSIWKTRKKLEELNKVAKPEPSEYTEFTIDLTTKVDSCVELSSVQMAGGYTVNHVSKRDQLLSYYVKTYGLWIKQDERHDVSVIDKTSLRVRQLHPHFEKRSIDFLETHISYVENGPGMSDGLRSPSDLIVRFNVGGRSYAVMKTTFPSDSVFYKYFVSRTKEIPFILDKDGAYFVDRDPDSKAKQMWETCLPKDPDRLALLTQEAEYFSCHSLRDQAILLLQACSEKSDATYVAEVLAKSASCPQGFDKILDHD